MAIGGKSVKTNETCQYAPFDNLHTDPLTGYFSFIFFTLLFSYSIP